MLSEHLEKESKIGSVESIAYITRWISNGTNTIEDMVKCVQGQPNIKISEVRPILGLFEIMSLIEFKGETIINKALNINDVNNFSDWFIPKYVDFIVNNNYINLNGISYSITKNKYVLSPTAINPRKHACYRNLLIDLGLIDYCTDGSYIINEVLDKAMLARQSKKMSENELYDNLEKQKVQGREGEEFVLAYERERICNPELKRKIERISVLDVSAGFDIVSFNDDNSKTFDRFIEVKTYVGKPHFCWSKNEIEKARLMGDAYFMYLVDFKKIGHHGYCPQCISNPVKNIIPATEWTKTSQIFLFELQTVDGYFQGERSAIHLQDSNDSQDELNNYINSVSVIESFVDTAIRLGTDSIHSFETILSKVNNASNGIYGGCLKKLKNAEDNSKNDEDSIVGRLENCSTVDDTSGKVPSSSSSAKTEE